MPDTNEHSPEVELLLCCARTQIDDEAARRIQTLADASLDWGSVLRLAEEHLVLPLLSHVLNDVAPDAAPPDVQDRLRTGFHANVRNNLLLAHELLDLLELFDEQDIPVVPFKGPVAAASIYDDLHLRPFGDLDLLVHLQDVPRAQTLLRDHQFRDWETLPSLSRLDFDRPPSWRSALVEPFSKAKNYVRTSENNQIVVELHWDLMPPYFRHPLDTESVWERLRTVRLLDTPVRAFSLEDTLFYFCLHGTVHRWGQLRLVCDVAELLCRQPDIKWDELQGRASDLNSQRLLLLGLHLAHALLEAPLPPAIERRIQGNNVVASLAQRCERRLFHRQSSLGSIWDRYAFNVHIRDRLADGIGLCLTDTWAALPKYLPGIAAGER